MNENPERGDDTDDGGSADSAALVCQALAAGFNAAGAGRGLPPLHWYAYRDLGDRWQVTGEPYGPAGDRIGIDIARRWADTLGLVQRSPAGMFHELDEPYEQGRHYWTGRLAGHRLIIHAAYQDPELSEWHPVRLDPHDHAVLNRALHEDWRVHITTHLQAAPPGYEPHTGSDFA